jgi:proline dehydrogenase
MSGHWSGRFAARPSRSLRISAAGGGALTATLVLGLGYSLYAEAPVPSEERVSTPLSSFLTSYVVYSICSVPGLVDASPALLAFCTSVPGIRQLTEAFVRATFFKQVVLAVSHLGNRFDLKKCRIQFVGGDTAQECLPSIRKLRAENKGTLLAYSVEADGNETADEARRSPGPTGETPPQRIAKEMIRAIDVAADYEDCQIREDLSSGRRTWVAIKLVSNCLSLAIWNRHAVVHSDTERPLIQPGRVGPPLGPSVLASRARPYAVPWLPARR